MVAKWQNSLDFNILLATFGLNVTVQSCAFMVASLKIIRKL